MRMPGMRTAAVIPAAGRSTRMGSNGNKLFMELAGRPVLSRTLDAFERCGDVDGVVLVVAEQDVDLCERGIVKAGGFGKVAAVVVGGEVRQESVRRGLEVLDPETELVVVHDGARPLVTPELISRVVAEARRWGAAVAAVPVKDTIKRSNGEFVACSLEREELWAVQTPQAFWRALVVDAHRVALRDGFMASDDAGLVERLGRKVRLVRASEENLKLTTPVDFLVAERILAQREGKAVAGGSRL